MKQLKKSQQSGFTLLEIIVVVTIIAILAAYMAPKIAGRTDDARVSKARSDIRILESSLELYKLDNFTYPSTEDGLKALVQAPDGAKNWRKGGYIKKLRKDPWGNDYLYLNPGEHGEIDIYTLGADGQQGGEGAAKDLGNWDIN